MKKILIIGGGAMGSAFTFPCIDNKNEVSITEPYNKTFFNAFNVVNQISFGLCSTHPFFGKYCLNSN